MVLMHAFIHFCQTPTNIYIHQNLSPNRKQNLPGRDWWRVEAFKNSGGMWDFGIKTKCLPNISPFTDGHVMEFNKKVR